MLNDDGVNLFQQCCVSASLYDAPRRLMHDLITDHLALLR
jgi:hypothetical protein